MASGAEQRYWETKMPVLYEERDIGPFLNRVSHERIGPCSNVGFSETRAACLRLGFASAAQFLVRTMADVARSEHRAVGDRVHSRSSPCPEGRDVPGTACGVACPVILCACVRAFGQTQRLLRAQQERQIESSFVAVLSAISSVSYCIYGRRLLRQVGPPYGDCAPQ